MKSVSVRLTKLSLKYPRFTKSDCKDIGIRKFKFVAKAPFLWHSAIRAFVFNIEYSNRLTLCQILTATENIGKNRTKNPKR